LIRFPARAIPASMALLQIIQQCPFDGGIWGLAFCDRFANTQFRVHQISSRYTSAMHKLHEWMLTSAIDRHWRNLEKTWRASPGWWQPSTRACLKRSLKPSRLVLPWIRQRYCMIVTGLSMQSSQCDGSILSWTIGRLRFTRRSVDVRKTRDLRFVDHC
jgi:hypothetical protein